MCLQHFGFKSGQSFVFPVQSLLLIKKIIWRECEVWSPSIHSQRSHVVCNMHSWFYFNFVTESTFLYDTGSQHFGILRLSDQPCLKWWQAEKATEGQKGRERLGGKGSERDDRKRRQRSVFIGLFLEATNVPLTLLGKILPQRFLQT